MENKQTETGEKEEEEYKKELVNHNKDKILVQKSNTAEKVTFDEEEASIFIKQHFKRDLVKKTELETE